MAGPRASTAVPEAAGQQLIAEGTETGASKRRADTVAVIGLLTAGHLPGARGICRVQVAVRAPTNGQRRHLV
jgi:hypothetical protein